MGGSHYRFVHVGGVQCRYVIGVLDICIWMPNGVKKTVDLSEFTGLDSQTIEKGHHKGRFHIKPSDVVAFILNELKKEEQ